MKTIFIEGGYIEDGNYYFYKTDHLGNNRIVADASGEVIQKTDYFPFGQPIQELSRDEGVHPYKFGDKEYDTMHGLNLYDFHARQYDPILGRFTSVDPLAECSYSQTPYHYCSNNPINRIDPTGMMDDGNGDLLKWVNLHFPGIPVIYGGELPNVVIIGKKPKMKGFDYDKYREVLQTIVSKPISGTTNIEDQNRGGGSSGSTSNSRGFGGMSSGYSGTGGISLSDAVSGMAKDQPQFVQGEVSFWQELSYSDNFFANLGYNIVNDVTVAMKSFFGFAFNYGPENELTGGRGVYNLDGTPNFKMSDSFVNTIGLVWGIYKGGTVASKATGGVKQWIRPYGKSFSRKGDYVTYGTRWGASPRYVHRIGNPTLRRWNQSLRQTKLPGNNWRVQDPGHFHWKK
ncbi:RHS repeat-associated protein [Dysgonomonas sp. PH5-45]|uniref:RHS repeat domain-containing protein n=1 Tax=unclassified Dysgonomonas TaxID=2630389 RepID=UPI002476418E|nr:MULTISPECIES: RHS repeat-associated core domain-containing protein [unclassified Dysgonomonas]MDH6354191.1 RHS repeat-associated protein [Dysgonomonas sp. PH5-45]MDH6387092.1 RHS repeat-associated protein [Dysgonomonas sp. PH5-37]